MPLTGVNKGDLLLPHLKIKLFENLFNISQVTFRYRQADMMKLIYVSMLLQLLVAPMPKNEY
jgi:hypothetical protein